MGNGGACKAVSRVGGGLKYGIHITTFCINNVEMSFFMSVFLFVSLNLEQ